MENLQFFKIGFGHYGRYGHYGHYAKRLTKRWNLQKSRFSKIGCGEYGRYGRNGHYGRYGRNGNAKRFNKGEIWKICSFSKLALGTMGAMGITGTMPKGSKMVNFGKFTVFSKMAVGYGRSKIGCGHYVRYVHI